VKKRGGKRERGNSKENQHVHVRRALRRGSRFRSERGSTWLGASDRRVGLDFVDREHQGLDGKVERPREMRFCLTGHLE
jgi:hypothetical protein